jgi:hypothetical protein
VLKFPPAQFEHVEIEQWWWIRQPVVKLVDHFLRQAAIPESLVIHQRKNLDRVIALGNPPRHMGRAEIEAASPRIKVAAVFRPGGRAIFRECRQ